MVPSNVARAVPAAAGDDPRDDLAGELIDHNIKRDLVRFQHLCRHLHSLGPRSTYEILLEVADGADVLDRLEVYARLDPGVVSAIGADRMPPLPITLVEGRRS